MRQFSHMGDAVLDETPPLFHTREVTPNHMRPENADGRTALTIFMPLAAQGRTRRTDLITTRAKPLPETRFYGPRYRRPCLTEHL